MEKKKFSKLRQTATHMLNIAPEEWEKVSFSWGMKLFLTLGHIIGHTAFLALFATRFGIEALPFFFLANAALAMVSTILITPLLDRVKKETLLIALSLAGMLALLGAFIVNEEFIQTAVILAFIATGAITTQVGIVLSLFIEEQYTPYESQRTFPIIESAEVIGALIGGFMVSQLVHFMHATDLFMLWSMTFLGLAIILGIYSIRSQVVPQLSFKHKREERGRIVDDVREGFVTLKRVNFLRAMVGIVMVGSAIFKIVEFQYTSALATMAGASHGGGHGSEAGVTDELTHDLGMYIVVFSAAAIILQLFFSSRIIRRMGTVPSMMLNPGISLAGFFAMFISFSPYTAVGARFLYDMTQIIYKDAYLSSYYAVAHRVREKAKAVMEGWILPLGAIAGTLIILFVGKLFHENTHEVTQTLSGILIAGAVIIFVLLHFLRKHYTQLSVVTLNTGGFIEKHTAIEILGDRGHQSSDKHLIRRLHLANESHEIKSKVLEALGRLQKEDTIPAILDCFSHPNLTVKTSAVEALANFPNLGSHFYGQAFAKYRIEHSLKEIFVSESSARLKNSIMKVFANLKAVEIIPFLLQVLQEGDPELKADCIQVIGSFHDPNIIHFVKPYLKDNDPRLKSNAIIALWQFEHERLNLLVQMVQLMGKDDRDSIISALFVIGELKSRQELPIIEKHLKHEDPKIRRHASMALLKLGEYHAIDNLIEIVLGQDIMESYKVRQMMKRVDRQHRQVYERKLHQKLSRKISNILTPVGHDPHRLDRVKMMELIRLYDIAGQHSDVQKLKEVLKEIVQSGSDLNKEELN
jgi:HEAT repeat protein/ATP/ADP translocase